MENKFGSGLIPSRMQESNRETFGFNYNATTIHKVYLKYSKRFIDIEWIDQTGGSGTIFKVLNVANSDDLLVKIYCNADNDYVCNAKKLDEEKIDYMIKNYASLPLRDKACWPIDAVYYDKDCKIFLGFIMKKAKVEKDVDLDYRKFSLFNYREGMYEAFETLDRVKVLSLYIELLNIFKTFHENNIVYGDVHPDNFLFDTKGNVYVIDMDSVQINEYPTSFFKPAFLPGSLIRQYKDDVSKYFETHYRLKEYDEYCFAIMLFDALVSIANCDGSQYSTLQDEGSEEESLIESTCKCAFPYYLSEEKANNSKVPTTWAMNWSHLPHFVKCAFYKVFKEKGTVTIDEWIEILTRYSKLIQLGKVSGLISNDTFASYEAMKIDFERSVSCKGCSIYSAFCKTLIEVKSQDLLDYSILVDLYNSAKEICNELRENDVVKRSGIKIELKSNRGVLSEIAFVFVPSR